MLGVRMTETVLVVDDSPHNRASATRNLEAGGYRVTAVASGEAALEHLAQEPVDLVVLDVMMPGVGGYETCRRIRATPAIRDIAVLFVTGLDDRATTEPALEAGADDLLAKPFGHTELLLRVRALIRLRRQAKQLQLQHDALRRISQLIVQDLRNPTTSIMANAAFMSEQGLPAESAEAASDILIAARHLDSTIRDLLDLSRAKDAAVRARKERLDLAELVREIATASRSAGRWKSVTIAHELRVETLLADAGLMRRMLLNLVHNAIKHAPASSQVTITTHRDAAGVIVRVRDHGPGVPEPERQRIFEHYGASGSHGVGLAFCRLAAEAHGGTIWVEANDPTGAVFCVVLPNAC
jgi:two-component system sensor histidine kinase/response regulator